MSVKWFRKAARRGDAGAQYNLGVCFRDGLGVPQDNVEAAIWFRNAAEQGDTEAQGALRAIQDR
ncbi:MAG: hypothetical protein WCJ35_27055 [Planctomycetota bacterium]